jgi:hypothetical protein
VASNQLIQVEDDELDLEESLDKGHVCYLCVCSVCARALWVCVCSVLSVLSVYSPSLPLSVHVCVSLCVSVCVFCIECVLCELVCVHAHCGFVGLPQVFIENKFLVSLCREHIFYRTHCVSW